MFATARVRKRLEALCARFGPAREPDGTRSLEDAVADLERVIDAHFLEAARAGATENRLVRALDVIPHGIVLADDQGAVVFRNRSASGFFAARHSEALVEAAIAELIADAVAGISGSRTLDLYGPPRRALLLRSVPLGDEARPDGACLVVEDVSDRQRLDAVRRDFVANISHELKSPVGAIGLLAETIAMQDDPEVTQRLAERMQQEAFRVARTIDDLLELSRIEAEEHPPREPVRLDLVVAEAVDRTTAAAELRDVKIWAEEPSPRITVIGDRRQLVSAAANLLDNAVKYSDPGAVVRGPGSHRRPLGRDRCHRPRHRHPGAGPRAGVRALLPRRPGAQSSDGRERWYGARAGHRAPRGEQSPRGGAGRFPRG